MEENIMATISEYASFLSRKGTIKKIGLYGSVIKDKKQPNDIDLVLFIDEDKALEFINDYADAIKTGEYPKFGTWLTTHPKGNEEDFFQEYYLELTDQKSNELAKKRNDRIKKGLIPLKFTILSNMPSESFLRERIATDHDPNFLSTLLNEVLIFNPDTDQFERQNTYSEETRTLITRLSQERLKELAQGQDEQHLDRIESRKRN